MVPTSKKLSFLVVDNEPAARELVSSYVSELFPDASVIKIGDGSEAIQKMSVQKFDGLILDFKIPRRDGVAVIQAAANFLDSSFKPKCIIIYSAHGDPRAALRTVPGVNFMPKPVEAQAFKQTLKAAFEVPVAQKPSGGTPKIDVGFITPFIESTLKVLKMTAGVEAAKKETFIRGPGQVSGDISALIAMNSQKYLGSMAVSFEENAFLHVVSSMLGEKYTEITPDIQDAAAELCNQIFGMTKTVMNAQGHTLQSAIPSVIVGKGHQLTHSVQGPCLVVRFALETGTFTVETAMQPIT